MSASVQFTARAKTTAMMPLAGGGVAHCQRRLEPWLLLAVAGHVAWVAQTGPEAAVLWPFVLVAALSAGWAWLPPVDTRPDLAMRGLLLVVGACLVHAHAAPILGGLAGLLMFWLGIVVLYYATLLTPVWRVSLLLVALLGLLGFAPRGIGEVPSAVMAQAGLVCLLLGLVAAGLGRFSGAPSRVDSLTRLHSEVGMMVAGDRMLAKAREAEEPLSIAVFSFPDLVEVRSIYGNQTCSELIRKLVRDLRRLPNTGGIAARSGPTEFTVVFPNRDIDDVQEAVEHVLGHPACFEFESGDDEIVLVQDLIIRTAGNSDSFAGLHGASSAALAEQQQQERLRREQLQRERERHSRPMPFAPTPAASVEVGSTTVAAPQHAVPASDPELRPV
jgi:GGDEF domain-containing protein